MNIVERFAKLTKGEKQQITRAMKKDSRLKQLHATMLERPLNLLEEIMLKQLLNEHFNNNL